ncbi:MAG: tRNA-dihydrouridine synthase family protein [Phycisphaerae bacterium]|nr:tRNA-dihydrouridine synthase family protein [Phycisphaerae bacterium]
MTIEFPVVLAPLAGYSDLAYRLLCRRHGAAYCSTEMMLDKLLLVDGRLRRRLVQLDDRDHPLAGQLIGGAPETMAAAARIVCQMGFDVVDVNFACPARKALARQRGGYLMSRPEQAVAILRAVLAAGAGPAPKPVTVKLRQKFRNADDDSAFWRIAEAALEAGAAAVCIHARSVEMKYTGRADWAFIAEVKRRFPQATIIGSGDVLHPADALEMLERTGVDAVAAARGVLGNPWFFRQVADLAAGREPYQPRLDEQRELLAWHFDHARRTHGPRAAKIMRKFGIKYARMHPAPTKVRAAFVNVSCSDHWQAVLEEFYGGG